MIHPINAPTREQWFALWPPLIAKLVMMDLRVLNDSVYNKNITINISIVIIPLANCIYIIYNFKCIQFKQIKIYTNYTN